MTKRSLTIMVFNLHKEFCSLFVLRKQEQTIELKRNLLYTGDSFFPDYFRRWAGIQNNRTCNVVEA